MSHGFPQGMTIAPKNNLYYAQYDMDYAVGGNGDNVIKAKPVTRRRGRPTNLKVENQELQVYEIEKLRISSHKNIYICKM